MVGSSIYAAGKCNARCVLFSDTHGPSFHSNVIFRWQIAADSIGTRAENMRPFSKIFSDGNCFRPQETTMITSCTTQDNFEISPRFRSSIEERIERLERDAAHDEGLLDLLSNGDHIRRQMRLVAMQRFEALRMRLFLDRAKTRLPRPMIAL
jgi:hypothetical protein